MSSVTNRIKEIKQPRGGYIKPSSMKIIELDDGKTLNEQENIHSSVVGMAVDYMTRFKMGADIKEAFKISLIGAKAAEFLGKNDYTKKLNEILKNIKGLDDTSIIDACKAVTFDVWYRNPKAAELSKGADETNPDKDTIENIKILIERSLSFFEKYGPITKDGFTFEEKGYTNVVDAGDGDFLTKDTLWDFKVSKSEPKSDHTLQLLMYYIMGKHSEQSCFDNIDKMGIFNPRLNKVYLLEVSSIPNEIIKTIEKDVICY